MADAALRTLDPWLPFLDALRRTAPEGTRETVFEGTVFRRSWGGQTLDDGVDQRHAAGNSRDSHRVLSETIEPLRRLVGERGCAVRARARHDGTADVRLLDVPDGVTLGLGAELFDSLVRVPDADPEPYRREPARHDGVGPSPGADPDTVTSLARAALPAATPARPDEIDAAEAELGAALPADVRALYLAAGSGELILRPEADDLFYGLRIVPLDDDASRSSLVPRQRYGSWRFGATEVAVADPEDRVQPLAASPAWFVVGDDWGGNSYVVDLAPGPRGHVGQVLFVDHETNSGARWVAPSLTELLVRRPTALAPSGAADEALVRIGAHTGRTIAEVGPGTEVVIVNKVPDPVDLSPIAGHPRVRTLVVNPGPVTGLDVVTRLPALEYLALSPAAWHHLLEAGQVPPTLMAAGFSGPAGWTTSVEVANALLARWGRPPIEVTVLGSEVSVASAPPPGPLTGADDGNPAHPAGDGTATADGTSPVSADGADGTGPAHRRPRGARPWWRRLFGGRAASQ